MDYTELMEELHAIRGRLDALENPIEPEETAVPLKDLSEMQSHLLKRWSESIAASNKALEAGDDQLRCLEQGKMFGLYEAFLGLEDLIKSHKE